MELVKDMWRHTRIIKIKILKWVWIRLFLSKICDINEKILYENNKETPPTWQMGITLRNGGSINFL